MLIFRWNICRVHLAPLGSGDSILVFSDEWHMLRHGTLWLMIEVDTDIVETCEARPIYILNMMVRHKESLFPAHENSPPVVFWHGQVRPFEFVFYVAESRESLPMHHIFLFSRAPIASQKPVATPDDLGIEISGELRPVLGQAPDTQVSTEEGRGEIDIHDGYVNIIAVSTAFLGAGKGSPGVETMMSGRTHSKTGDVDEGIGGVGGAFVRG